MEIKHPKWLANPVIVLKKNKAWCMCIYYTNLNRACPKDSFILPRIDQIIDATAGSESLGFLDAYSGYNKIKMAVEDQEKMTFITPLGAYCYTAMTFGLRNAGATYQQCMNSCLESQIRRTVHVYIDDVVVKSTQQDDLVADLIETFANLRRFQIKLNPLKCTFGVPSGQLLDYVVSKRGIEPNPEKISAVMRIKRPACLLDAQKLVGRVVALSRFIPQLGDKALLYESLEDSPRHADHQGDGRVTLLVAGDSDLVASQISGTCDATDANMISYKRAVEQASASFSRYVVEWVDRHKNEEADALSRLGSKRQPPPPGVFLDILTRRQYGPARSTSSAIPRLLASRSRLGRWD
ncbi:hypothetical protein QYE76_054358 [Lolium multiflorum]|uniref:Reverse transcriptase domain-containing protein n=1 Tax=Lolium multiflorum TaxID=4521 RepID=A0AAD8SY49_LOLMU|nr:hypothetical protein QYE76_054358 [Lolium multiflorum]